MQQENPYQSLPFSNYLIANPEEFAANLLKAFEQGTAAFSKLAEQSGTNSGPYSSAGEISTATENMLALARMWLSNPVTHADAQQQLVTQFASLWNNVLMRMLGAPVSPLIEPNANDNRFKDPEWTHNPFFDFCKQAYLLLCQWAEDRLRQTPGLDERERHRAEFYLRQVTSAYSPSNFLATNPEVLRETLRTNAQNLVDGTMLLAHDLGNSHDQLQISQTDASAFEVGRNLATTPGKVVFQNDLFQLIQYSPTTEKVHETPLLMIPPWINKFYILDLTREKSFIKYVVDQGFTVFVISWVNPGEDLAHKSFEDYILEGVLAAADAARRETGLEQINVLGYCVGGTALATALAYTAQRGEAPFKSCTFLATQIDFSLAGDLLLFTETAQLDSLNALMEQRGYLDGSRMANVFNMMRPRDLIWPYVVNNYMLGKKPFPFDLLFWNQDSTRMAAANHKFYLREFYNENRLASGEMVIGGVKLDIGKLSLPVFAMATREDHIAPAASCYRGALMLTCPVEFVLAGSGHIAGVVNPPGKVKYQYWTNNQRPAALDAWIAGAQSHPGSWWPHWITWLESQSGGFTAPRLPGKTLGALEDAPGRYVRER